MLNRANQLVVFHSLCTHGSFSVAAKKLGCSTSHVSKQLNKLEDELGLQLVLRTSRQIKVTDDGHTLLKHATTIVEALEQAEHDFEMLSQEVSGTVRLAISQSFGTMHIIPLLDKLKLQFPLLNIEVLLTDYKVDMVKENVDLWITHFEHLPEGYIAQRLVDTKFVLAASPSYLANSRPPIKPEDLLSHNCITYRNRHKEYNLWLFKQGKEEVSIPANGNYKVDLAEAVRDAVVADWGIGYLATYLIRDEFSSGKLIQLLPDWTLSQPMPLFVVYPRREHLPNKVRVIVEHLRDIFSGTPVWDVKLRRANIKL
jgi:DNA-binding transcriptional LysR family regulator